MRYNIFLLIIISFFACKTKKEVSDLKLSDQHQIVFLDSVQASVAINTDERDHFFENIQELEMAIQMKTPLNELNPSGKLARSQVLEKYQNFLATEVEAFTPEDMAFVNSVFSEAFTLCNSVSKNIFPKRIRLIKTKANHYGEGTYYTREDIIVIPFNALAEKDKSSFLKVMLHEIAHIYSRYNDSQREELYALIGFYPLQKPLIKNEVLQKRILHNPDGIDFNFYIELESSTKEKVKAVPIIISTEDDFNKSKPAFFSHLKFEIFEIEQNPLNDYVAISNEKGFSKIDLKDFPDFFAQIKDNTNYIIHPDEIIADNFMFVVLAEKNGGEFKGYSEEGTKLLEDIRGVLQK